MAKKWKDDWGSAIQLEDDLIRLRLRNPGKSLIVNTYLYRGGDTLAVIDPGWPDTIDGLEAALAQIGVAKGLADVDLWLYTHAHIDHMGSAALLQQHSDAPHVAWSGLAPKLQRFHAFVDDVHNWHDWIEDAFAEPHRSRLLAARSNHGGLVERFGPAALERVELIEFGETIEVGQVSLEFVDARGHDPHHGAFFERERGWLFSGDAVIAVPTPICRAMNDELDTYRDTLDRLEALDASFLLPGHGLHRRDNLASAFERSRGFVTEYETSTLAALRDNGGPVDLYELSIALTPDGRPYKPASRWWVHMAQVDSHLQALVASGEVVLIEDERGPLYMSA